MSINVRLQGADTDANDPLEAVVQLADVPRVGDQISAWTGKCEEYAEVADVCWMAWEYDHDPGPQEPVVSLRRADGSSDDEWREFFASINEDRRP